MNINELKLLKEMQHLIRKANVRRTRKHHAQKLIDQAEDIINMHATFIDAVVRCNICDTEDKIERRTLDPTEDFYVKAFLEFKVVELKCTLCEEQTEHTVTELTTGERPF